MQMTLLHFEQYWYWDKGLERKSRLKIGSGNSVAYLPFKVSSLLFLHLLILFNHVSVVPYSRNFGGAGNMCERPLPGSVTDSAVAGS